MSPLKAGSTVGILGGGQLGRMLAMAAARLGLSGLLAVLTALLVPPLLNLLSNATILFNWGKLRPSLSIDRARPLLLAA